MTQEVHSVRKMKRQKTVARNALLCQVSALPLEFFEPELVESCLCWHKASFNSSVAISTHDYMSAQIGEIAAKQLIQVDNCLM